MKYKTTFKAVKNGYRKVIVIPYCGAQYLLYFQNPVAYNAGVYGWNADIYNPAPGVAIVTGYRPCSGIDPDYETLRDYERRASAIVNSRSIPWENRAERVNALLAEFIATVLSDITFLKEG